MVGWHHWLNGHEFQQTPGDGEGQGSLACCSPWGRIESDTTEQLNKNNLSLCFFGTRKKYTLVSVKQRYSLRKGWITREEWIREDITLLLSLSSPGAMKAKSPLPKRRKLNTMCSSFKAISTPFHLLWQKKKKKRVKDNISELFSVITKCCQLLFKVSQLQSGVLSFNTSLPISGSATSGKSLHSKYMVDCLCLFSFCPPNLESGPFFRTLIYFRTPSMNCILM